MPPIERAGPTQSPATAQPDLPAIRDAADEADARDPVGGAQADVSLGTRVAALTESPLEADIDHRNGLRGGGGRRPQPEDFADVLSPEGDSGDVFGTGVDPDGVWALGEDGSTGGTL